MKIINTKNSIRSINCHGRKLVLGDCSKIMGIINLTPDSFSDGGDWAAPSDALKQAISMEKAGAHILDIGAESSRPGHLIISVEEEIKRLLPALEEIIKNTIIPISIDTWKSEVAEAALKKGANIINDIYGLKKDQKLAKVIAHYDAGVIIMHNQKSQNYPRGLITEIEGSLKESITIAIEAGIDKNKIILDPGIGFAKSPEQNIQLMNELSELKKLGFPLLLGASRKSLIGSVFNVPPKDRLPGTIATTVLGIIQGYEIFRVHDVAENLQAAIFTDAVLRRNNG